MRTVHRPLSELYHDLDDAVNVLANSSFELTDDDGNLTAWRVLAGSAKQVSRGDSHAMLFSGRVRSTRFECNARVPYEWLGEAKGRLTGQVFFMEGDMLLRSESFVHESADWEPFVWRFLPPPNAERAECELEGDGALVDELRLDGLGAEDYRFLDPQAGFHPAGLKRVILQTRVPIDSEVAWELFDTLNGQTHAKGMLEPLGQDIWRRWSYAADFTSLGREGYYLLRATLPDRVLESPPLRVWNGLYTFLAETVAKYSYLQRCGVDIPGYHKACHTNDAVFRVLNDQSRYGEIEDPHDDSNGFRDVTGGWHDAGDYNKWFHYFGYVEETLALMWKRMDLPKTTYGGEIPDVLSEVFWGADFFAKLQNRDGSLPGPICGYYTHENPETGEKRNSPWAIFWEDPHEDAGAGEHLHPRTRTFDYVGHNPNPGRDLDLAASVAAAARCARGVDDARCGRYVNMVLRTAGYVESAAPELATSPFWLTLYYDLYRATDNEEYLEKANGLVPKLLAMQKDDGSVPYSALHKAFRPIDVLLELLIDESNHPMRSKIIAAAEKLVAWLRPHRIGAPYELTTMPVADVEPGVLDSRTMGRNAYIGSVAYTYALVARVTGNRELLHEAERQLGWLLGVNPHGVCQVTDAGRVHPNRYHGWHNRNDNDKCGALTGGIINGIHVPKEDGDATHPWTIQPPRFPILSVRRGDVPYSEHFLMNARHDTNEYWSLHHGGFQEAVAALGAAYAGLSSPKHPKACLFHSNTSSYADATAYDGTLNEAGWDLDRMNSDAGFPHADPRRYDAFICAPNWVGSEHPEDAEAIGIHVRRSWEIGVPWVVVGPMSEACEAWIDEVGVGLLPDGETKDLRGGPWTAGPFGRQRRMGTSTVFVVDGAAELSRMLEWLGARGR